MVTTGGGRLLSLGVLTVLFVMCTWWRDIIGEGLLEGYHTSTVQDGLRLGMILFIISVFFFVCFFAFLGFFWGFFYFISYIYKAYQVTPLLMVRKEPSLEKAFLAFLSAFFILLSFECETVST